MTSARFVLGWVLVFLTSHCCTTAADAVLADANERDDPEAVRALLDQHVDVNAAQVDGMTALHWAVYHDDQQIAEVLIKAGADAKAVNRYGVTPLSIACTN